MNNFMTKGEVKLIILDGHSNQTFLAETPIYGKTEITTHDAQFTNLNYSSSYKII
ncbi:MULTISPECIES: XtrA/YqaO family protein [Bacillus]|uniref:XtrA/YqaO family protein n=1 Tax=Bacillus sp. WP8 TaxID=756828 RepID=UPI0021B5DBEF|nr:MULTISPECIES: XtrA/YqaO family protein [Bacillus]MDI0272436.1 XtrA/YqaO family protein [Bacillus safensis]MEC1115046.1 XtrA/YqaO family protein [Bacillus safensis]MED1578880.1 XtrA/YqaO family protein [Bacillus safensis]WAT82720.1 XtrA/YqaO family protein [Bacillus safensis]